MFEVANPASRSDFSHNHACCLVSFHSGDTPPVMPPVVGHPDRAITSVIVCEPTPHGRAFFDPALAGLIADGTNALCDHTIVVCCEPGPERAAGLADLMQRINAQTFLVTGDEVELAVAPLLAACERRRISGADLLQVDVALNTSVRTTYPLADYLRFRRYMENAPGALPQVPGALANVLLSRKAMTGVVANMAVCPSHPHWHKLVLFDLLATAPRPAVSTLLIGRRRPRISGRPHHSSPHFAVEQLLSSAVSRLTAAAGSGHGHLLALAALHLPACFDDLTLPPEPSANSVTSGAVDHPGRLAAMDALAVAVAEAGSTPAEVVPLAAAIADHLGVAGLPSLEISWATFLHIVSSRLHTLLLLDPTAPTTPVIEPLLATLDWQRLPQLESTGNSISDVEELVLVLHSLTRTRGGRQPVEAPNAPGSMERAFAWDNAIPRLLPLLRNVVQRSSRNDAIIAQLKAELADLRASQSDPGRVARAIAEAIHTPGWNTVMLPARLTNLGLARLKMRLNRTKRY